jgi:hypothetical protein
MQDYFKSGAVPITVTRSLKKDSSLKDHLTAINFSLLTGPVNY